MMEHEMDGRITVRRAAISMRLVKYWLPVAVMLGSMYYFSTDTFSEDNTRSAFDDIVLWFLGQVSEQTLATISFVVRKSAHFLEYALLGALLFRAFRADSSVRWRLNWAIYSFAAATSWALIDELHQSFTRTRGGSIRDTLIDSSGALCSMVLIAAVTRTKTAAPTE
jgi:VanZ family protein